MVDSMRVLFAFLGVCAISVGSVEGQTTGPNNIKPHEHIAPLADTSVGPRLDKITGRASPRFNVPNGIWDNGEGFSADVDQGGYESFDDGTGLEIWNIFHCDSVPWGEWNDDAGGRVYRFRGRLGGGPPPSPLPTAPRPIAEAPTVEDKASFTVWGLDPDEFDSERPNILVVITQSTIPGDTPFPGEGIPMSPEETEYPEADQDGCSVLNIDFNDTQQLAFWNASITGPGVVRMSDELGFNIFAASITPPQAWNPNTFIFQRNLQLVRAVHLLLPHGPYEEISSPLPQMATTVAGGSNGGYNATHMTWLFPNKFHGAMSDVSSGDIQRLLGRHDAMVFTSSLLGWEGFTQFGTLRELQWNMPFHQLGTSIEFSSFAARLANDLIRRPQYFLFADEDRITSPGEDWINLIRPAGNMSSVGEILLEPPSDPGPGGGEPPPPPPDAPAISWSIRGKNSHGLEKKEYPRLPAGTSTDINVAMKRLIRQTAASFEQRPVVLAPDLTTPPWPQGWVVNTFDQVFARPKERSTTPPSHLQAPSDQGRIAENLAFAENLNGVGFRNGQGLGMGRNESLVTHGGFVYVGSADGVVTKFKVDSSEASQPFEPRKVSVELGYGVNALAISSDGTRLVAGTYRHLFVLDSDLNIVHQTPSTYGTEWKHTNPRRIVLADLVTDGSSEGEEIIYVTMHGGLFVRSPDLSTEICAFPEPGIVDLVVPPIGLPSLSGNSMSEAVFILSRRGHVACLELGRQDGAFDEETKLRAVSPIQHAGGGFDLEFVSEWPGVGENLLVAYYAAENSFRFFECDTLDLEGQLSNVGARQDTLAGAPLSSIRQGITPDIAIHPPDGPGQPLYVHVIHNGMYFLVDQAGTVVAKKWLRSYGPTQDALAVVCDEVNDQSAGAEIILSTLGGQVTWLSLADVIAPGPQGLQDVFALSRSPGPQGLPFLHTNKTIAGSWAMTVDEQAGTLQVADQTGTRWEISPDGTVAFKEQLKFFLQIFGVHFNAISPIQDLVHAGTTNGIQPGNQGAGGVGGFKVVFDSLPGAGTNPKWSHAELWTHNRRRPPLDTQSQLWFPLPSFLSLADNYWVFPFGGDAISWPDSGLSVFWSGEDDPSCFADLRGWENHALRVGYDIVGGQGSIRVNGPGSLGVWGSGGQSGSPPAEFMDFRSDDDNAHDWQALRLGKLKGNDMPGGQDGYMYAAMTTSGGRLFVIAPEKDAPSIEVELGDHGYGGIALAVGNLDNDPEGVEEIVFGSIYTHTDHAGMESMRAAIHVVDYQSSQFFLQQTIDLGSINLDPDLMPGFGVAGIAIDDVIEGAGYDGNEVVVTTLNGELYIFKTDGGGPGGPLVTRPVHASVHAGSLGACNSIVVADLDTSTPEKEIYIASSQGMYRFDIIPLP